MLAKYIARNENTASRIIDGQAVIMTLTDNTLHTLNAVGSRIWELCTGQKTMEEIIQIIQEEYISARPDEIRSDCEIFFKDLYSKGMVVILDEKAQGNN